MRLISVLVAAALALACGDDDEAAQAAAARSAPKVRPEAVALAPRAQTLFTVTPASLTVTWSVREAGGGSITAAGLYTAPSSAGTFHVVATAGGTSGEAVVTVKQPITIAAPASAATPACDPLQLAATVSGSTDTGVIWTLLEPGCGSVSSSGVFTSVRGTGTCQVQAQAHADPSAVAVTTITIAAERIVAVAVAPSSSSMAPGGTASFSATVTTSCGIFPAGG